MASALAACGAKVAVADLRLEAAEAAAEERGTVPSAPDAGATREGRAMNEDLRARYRAERDKRLRPDGADQYIEPAGRFATLALDPYVEWVERAPVAEDVTSSSVDDAVPVNCAWNVPSTKLN